MIIMMMMMRPQVPGLDHGTRVDMVFFFFMYVMVHVFLPFNFAILKESDLLWYPLHKYYYH